MGGPRSVLVPRAKPPGPAGARRRGEQALMAVLRSQVARGQVESAPGGAAGPPAARVGPHRGSARLMGLLPVQLYFNEKRPLAPRRRARLSARSAMALGPCARVTRDREHTDAPKCLRDV